MFSIVINKRQIRCLIYDTKTDKHYCWFCLHDHDVLVTKTHPCNILQFVTAVKTIFFR